MTGDQPFFFALQHQHGTAATRTPASSTYQPRPPGNRSDGNLNLENGMTSTAKGTAPDIGEYQSQLWRAADTLRGSIDAAEYKHVVLPLIFLKYISDAFEELHEELESRTGEGVDPEEPDYYIANNVFWVPQEARWSKIQAQARQQTNGATIDQAMTAIERDNQALRGRTAEGLRARRVGQASAWAGDRPRQQRQGRRG